MELEFRLTAFEGPLDLLLHLIDRDKINIYDIPIVQITEQYMAYVDQMDRTDLDLVSEFLVMAATLLDIKARMLLPKEEEAGEAEEEDPRAELVRRLLEYRKYKELGADLKDLSVGSEQHFYNPARIPREVAEFRPPTDLDALLEGVTSEKLKALFEDAMRRVEDRIDKTRSTFGKIRKEAIPISARVDFVKESVRGGKKLSFRKLLKSGATREELIVTFLAILELMKTGEVKLTEDSTIDDFTIEERPHEPESGEN